MGYGRWCRDCGMPGIVLCADCANQAGLRWPLPRGFWDMPTLRGALAKRDFGPVFTAVRAETGLSQARLGELVSLDQPAVWAVEHGRRSLEAFDTIARVITALEIPPAYLGLGPGPTPPATDKEDTVDRRQFLTAAAVLLGAGTGIDAEQIDALLPTGPGSTGRRRIGAADVQAICALTDGFRRSTYSQGGGLCRAAAIAQLHEVRRLDDANCTPQVRTDMLIATAELADIAGWAAYDVEDHDIARRLWTYAVATLRRVEAEPRAADLTVAVLLDLADQALYLHGLGTAGTTQLREAVRLVHLASSITVGGLPVSAHMRSYVQTFHAWCHAAAGEAERARAAMASAQDIYAGCDRAGAPAWASFITDAELDFQGGQAAYLLSAHDPAHAALAIDRLGAAVANWGQGWERARALTCSDLAVAHLRNGDPDVAATVGHRAADAIGALSTERGLQFLRTLDREAAPHARRPDVADLRDHIRATLTGAHA